MCGDLILLWLKCRGVPIFRDFTYKVIILPSLSPSLLLPDDEPSNSSHSTVAIVVTVVVVAVLSLFMVGGVLIGKGKNQMS